MTKFSSQRSDSSVGNATRNYRFKPSEVGAAVECKSMSGDKVTRVNAYNNRQHHMYKKLDGHMGAMPTDFRAHNLRK